MTWLWLSAGVLNGAFAAFAIVLWQQMRRQGRGRWAIRVTGPHGERYWLRTDGIREEYDSDVRAVAAARTFLTALEARG